MKETLPLELNSPAPLDDGGRKYNRLYFIFAVIGGITGLSTGGLIGAFVIMLFALCIAYAIKECIVDWKWKDLRKLKFHLDTCLSYDELISRLIPILTPLGMTIEKKENGQPVITHEHIIYDIALLKDSTFTIWWRKSPMRALAPKGALSYYRQTVISMGIIGYYIQQVCSNKETVYKEKNDVKYCTECGTKCNLSDQFCINCGNHF